MPVQDAPGLGHVLPIPWPHRRPIDAAPRPHSPGSVPNTRALGTLLLLANHPTAAATAALARQACQAQHCKVTCSARARLGTAGAALGTAGCGTDGQCSPPQLCGKAGSPEAADHLPTPLAQKQRTTCPPPSPSPTPLPEGQVLGQTVSQVQAEQQTGKSKHCGPPLCRATALQDGTQLLRVALAAAAAGTPRVNDLGFLPSQRSRTARRERQQQGRMGRDKSSGSWASEAWGPPRHPEMSCSRGQGT